MTIIMGDMFSEDIVISSDKGNIATNVVYVSEKSAVQAVLSDFDSIEAGPRSSHEYTVTISGSKIEAPIAIRIVSDERWFGASKIYDMSGNEIAFSAGDPSNTEIEFSIPR